MSERCLHLLSDADLHRDHCAGCASVPLHVAGQARMLERMFDESAREKHNGRPRRAPW